MNHIIDIVMLLMINFIVAVVNVYAIKSLRSADFYSDKKFICLVIEFFFICATIYSIGFSIFIVIDSINKGMILI